MKPHLLLICLLLNACSNLPPAIENPPPFDITYSQATQNITHFKDSPVRWGGVIVDVENEQTYSLVQVLYYPLNNYGRPKLNNPNEGRFVIKSPEFLDPAIYTKDTEITVAGTLIGDIERTIGKKKLTLPQVSASVIHLWPEYDRYSYYGYGGYGGFGYSYPYYVYPYWGGFYYPYRY